MTTGPSQFPTTRWSLVRAVAAGDDADARRALDELCAQAWSPIYVFLRRAGHGEDDARDLTQGFLARLVEKRDVGGADPERGRFRAYLIGALKHFVGNERERAAALKRGGGRVPVALDDVESWCAASRGDDPAASFERRWALDLLQRALGRLAEEQRHAGRGEIFAVLRDQLTADGTDASYAELGERAGLTVGAVKVAVHRLRRRYGELLRAEIASTVEDAALVDEELRDLRTAFVRPANGS